MNGTVLGRDSKPRYHGHVFDKGRLVLNVRLWCETVFRGCVIRVMVALEEPVIFGDRGAFVDRTVDGQHVVQVCQVCQECVQDGDFGQVEPSIGRRVVMVLAIPVFG